MENKKKTKIIVIVGFIILAVLALISVTYSLFYTEQVAPNPDEYSTGLLSIEVKSKSEVITLNNTLPMSDTDGANSDPYIFTIVNHGNLDYQFDIILSIDATNNFGLEYIKLKFDNDEPVLLNNLNHTTVDNEINITINESKLIIKAKESIDINLRVWLDEYTPNSQIGKTFKSKIVTEGQAIYTESNFDPLPKNPTLVSSTSFMNNLFTKTTTTSVNGTSHDVDEEHQLIKDPSGNIRYYGTGIDADSTIYKEPNNYIKFNCDTYPDTNCDMKCDTSGDCTSLWRIIGIVDGKLKLIRGSIGKYPWDSSASGVNDGNGINEWSQADLKIELNDYYYNSKSNQTCYNGQNNASITCDFSSTGTVRGLKNDETRSMIAKQTYYLRGASSSSIFANAAITMERTDGSVIASPNDGVTRTTTWTGKIAIPYPSDYGYATDLTGSNCTQNLNGYNNSENNFACRGNNWMWYAMTGASSASSASDASFAWLLTPYSSLENYVWNVGTSGIVNFSLASSNARGVSPVLSLSSEVFIASGDGSRENPYRLTL